MNKNTNNNSAPAAIQEQQQKPNVQDEPTAESRSAPAAEAGREQQAGGGSAPSPCSGLEGRPKNVGPPNGYAYIGPLYQRNLQATIEWIEMMIRGAIIDYPAGASVSLDVLPLFPALTLKE